MKTMSFAPFTQSPSFPQVRGSMPSAELAEYLDWIKEHGFYDLSDMPQNLDGLQRLLESHQHDVSVSALAQSIQYGDDVGYTEVQYDPQTGVELPVDDTYGILDFLADCAF